MYEENCVARSVSGGVAASHYEPPSPPSSDRSIVLFAPQGQTPASMMDHDLRLPYEALELCAQEPNVGLPFVLSPLALLTQAGFRDVPERLASLHARRCILMRAAEIDSTDDLFLPERALIICPPSANDLVYPPRAPLTATDLAEIAALPIKDPKKTEQTIVCEAGGVLATSDEDADFIDFDEVEAEEATGTTVKEFKRVRKQHELSTLVETCLNALRTAAEDGVVLLPLMVLEDALIDHEPQPQPDVPRIIINLLVEEGLAVLPVERYQILQLTAGFNPLPEDARDAERVFVDEEESTEEEGGSSSETDTDTASSSNSVNEGGRGHFPETLVHESITALREAADTNGMVAGFPSLLQKLLRKHGMAPSRWEGYLGKLKRMGLVRSTSYRKDGRFLFLK